MSDPYLRDVPPHRLTDEEIEGFANMCDSRNSTLYREIRALQADLAAEQAARAVLEARKDATTWEADHQRLKLQEVGLAEEFSMWGCDAIQHVAEKLIEVRNQRNAEKAARERDWINLRARAEAFAALASAAGPALLARLEAAEKVCNLTAGLGCCEGEDARQTETMKKALAVWRAARVEGT